MVGGVEGKRGSCVGDASTLRPRRLALLRLGALVFNYPPR